MNGIPFEILWCLGCTFVSTKFSIMTLGYCSFFFSLNSTCIELLIDDHGAKVDGSLNDLIQVTLIIGIRVMTTDTALEIGLKFLICFRFHWALVYSLG